MSAIAHEVLSVNVFKYWLGKVNCDCFVYIFGTLVSGIKKRPDVPSAFTPGLTQSEMIKRLKELKQNYGLMVMGDFQSDSPPPWDSPAGATFKYSSDFFIGQGFAYLHQ